MFIKILTSGVSVVCAFSPNMYLRTCELTSLLLPLVSSYSLDTDWPRSRCVQSCEPTPSNPHCAGFVAWNEHLFDTAHFCCQVTLNWLTIEECTSTGGSEIIAMSGKDLVANASSVEGISATNIEEETATVDDCPPDYDHNEIYISGSLVTLYENEVVGYVYVCKEGSLSAYCNIFGPHWKREADGGGSIHQDEGHMGWEFVEICTGIETFNSKVETTTETKPSKVTKPKEIGTMYSNSQAGCWRHGR